MAGHFQTLLEAIITDPDQSIATLPMRPPNPNGAKSSSSGTTPPPTTLKTNASINCSKNKSNEPQTPSPSSSKTNKLLTAS